MVKLLGSEDYDLTILDNLSSGHKDSVVRGDLIIGDLADKNLLKKILSLLLHLIFLQCLEDF